MATLDDGGPLKRYGGKGLTAHLLIPHFASAHTYFEPFFGGGGVFFQLPRAHWRQYAVNDVDDEVVAFFTVLRDRTEDLLRVCEFTPYAEREYRNAYLPVPLHHPDRDLERARRMWVRSRQGFAGIDRPGNGWGKPGVNVTAHYDSTESKLRLFRTFAATLRAVHIHHSDAIKLIPHYAREGAFIYADPPYVSSAREGAAYTHEMTDEAHGALAKELREAASRGARVALSGYATELYQDLYVGWREVRVRVPLHAVNRKSEKADGREEVLWCSYGAEHELPRVGAHGARARTEAERALLRAMKR